MTIEEIIAKLNKASSDASEDGSYYLESLLGEAADRIEALESQVRAADALAEQVQRVKDFRYDPNIGIELNRLEEALAAYRATKEGGA